MIKQLFQLAVLSLLLGLGLTGATAAPIDPTNEIKIIASDGGKDDLFGYSISLDGTRMAVGAYRAKVGSNDSQGKVYIYDFDGTNWNETAVLTADDGIASDLFGWSVSLSGDRIAVGSHWANVGTNIYQGAAYIFDLNGGTWTQTQKLTADDGAPFDQFSNALSLDGNRLIIGARNADPNNTPTNYQGVAYVFDLSGGAWNQSAKLVASDGAADAEFGHSVSLDGDRIVVGAPSTNVGNNISQGQVYVYDLNGANWDETAKLTATGGWLFGSSVSLDGNRLAVGDRFAKVGSNLKQGIAHIFDLSGTTWNESAKLTASDGSEKDSFGMAISLEGDRVAVGAHNADANGDVDRGETYVFDLSGTTWSETKFMASDGTKGDEYGINVAVDGDVLAVGAWSAVVNGNNSQGAVYVYGKPVPATYNIEVEVNGLTKALLERRSLNLNAKQGVSPQAKALDSELVLQNNGGDDLTITKDGSYTFATPVPKGSRFDVTVKTLPNKVNCTLTGGSGVAGVNTGGIAISCKALKTGAQRIPSLGNTALALLMLAFAATAWFIHRRRLTVR